MTRERMAWWRRSAEQLVASGWRQGSPGDATECADCGRGISGNRIWRHHAGGDECCRRCAVDRLLPPAVEPSQPQLRPLQLAILELFEDGWSDPAAIRCEAERRLDRRRRVSDDAWSTSWDGAKREFDRRCERRIHKPYDGSSRFGWRPGR